MSVEILASVLAIGGVCVAGINIIVEVLKTFWIKGETSYPAVVLCVSVFMSFMVTYAYCTLQSVTFTPLLFMGALVGGFFMAYGAMFGYDNLYGNFIKKIENIFREGDK